MERSAIEERKAQLEREHGPWTAHNVRLADGLYAIGAAPAGDEVKLRRVIQIVSDLARKPIPELRVLDLACLEGMYALELAARGAQVTAIEGREANLAKARLAGEALKVDVEWIHGDVRDLSREVHGEFDVVLCLGILYHLDAPDVFTFVRRLIDVCRDLVVIDTHAAAQAVESRTFEGRAYWGEALFEHREDASADEREQAVWSSLDNPRAFAPTRASLLNLLADAGFAGVYECLLPPEPDKPVDRITLVARVGARLEPTVTAAPPPWQRLNERRGGELPSRTARRLAASLSAPVRAAVRRLLGRPTPPRR